MFLHLNRWLGNVISKLLTPLSLNHTSCAHIGTQSSNNLHSLALRNANDSCVLPGHFATMFKNFHFTRRMDFFFCSRISAHHPLAFWYAHDDMKNLRCHKNYFKAWTYAWYVGIEMFWLHIFFKHCVTSRSYSKQLLLIYDGHPH